MSEIRILKEKKSFDSVYVLDIAINYVWKVVFFSPTHLTFYHKQLCLIQNNIEIEWLIQFDFLIIFKLKYSAGINIICTSF